MLMTKRKPATVIRTTSTLWPYHPGVLIVYHG